MDNEEQEEDILTRMTSKTIKEICRQTKMYTTPNLNETLYLHMKGFPRIENLDPYVNVTALYLGSNRIKKIENLDCLPLLKCLFLEKNLIKKIEGLEKLKNLETLDLSNNFIKKIENLEKNTKLCSLNLSANKIKEYDSFKEIENLKSLCVLDLKKNEIVNEKFIDLLPNLNNLKVLYLVGNPIQRKTKNYRKRIISENSLNFLDERPVKEKEKILAKAWKKGGREEEEKEKERMYEEEKNKEKKRLQEIREDREKAKKIVEERKRTKKIQELLSELTRKHNFDFKVIASIILKELKLESFEEEECRKHFVSYIKAHNNDLNSCLKPNWSRNTINKNS